MNPMIVLQMTDAAGWEWLCKVILMQGSVVVDDLAAEPAHDGLHVCFWPVEGGKTKITVEATPKSGHA